MSTPSLFSKSFSGDNQFTKQQIANILFVIKQILGLILGICIGLSGLFGIVGIGSYALISSLICYLYVFRFLQVDEDTVTAGQIIKEHFAPGFFSFMLTWIITYNVVNY